MLGHWNAATRCVPKDDALWCSPFFYFSKIEDAGDVATLSQEGITSAGTSMA